MARPSTLLGLDPKAPLADIKSRWRQLVAEAHPDRQTDPALKRAAEERFKELRAAYDRLLVGDDLDRNPPVRGTDVGLVVPMSWLSALRGDRVDIVTPDGSTLVVRLPPNATSGMSLRIPGRGGAGSPRGDLLLQLLVLEDPVYRVSKSDPYNLERAHQVTWLEAWLGSTIEVTTPWGSTWIDLRPATHAGQVYEIPVHGVRREDRWGALRLTIILVGPPAPDHLSPEVRQALTTALAAAYTDPQKKSEAW
jgi:DnaJ-class molecular chaperone